MIAIAQKAGNRIGLVRLRTATASRSHTHLRNLGLSTEGGHLLAQTRLMPRLLQDRSASISGRRIALVGIRTQSTSGSTVTAVP